MTSTGRSSLRVLTATTLSLSLALGNVAPSWAANHPNSSVQNVNVLNLTANVDWDYDAQNPATQMANANQVLNKAYITDVLRETARTMYLMTEGRHRVGTIYVYKNSRFADNVDIRMLNRPGRSTATLSAWNKSAGTSSNFLTNTAGQAQSVRNVGRVIAHELGHYAYGLYDEYIESGRAFNPQNPGSPADTDWAKTTVMNSQRKYVRMSLPADYEAGKLAENQTAQARMYATNRSDLTGGSAWETLVRDPKNDPNPTTQQIRTYFEAFKDVPVPQTVGSLSKYVKVLCFDPGVYLGLDCNDPVPGESTNQQRSIPSDLITDQAIYTSLLYAAAGGTSAQDAADGQKGSAFEDFKVVFADTPAVPNTGGAARSAETRTMLMIDTSLSVSNIARVIEIAQGLVNGATANDEMGIALADGTSPLLSPLVKTDAAGKAALLQALKAYTPTQGTLNLTAAYNSVLVPLQRSTGVEGDASQVTLLTYPNTEVSASLAQDARSKRVPISVVTISGVYGIDSTRSLIASAGGQGVDKISVEELSARSGGSAVRGKSVEDAIAKQAVESKQARGDNISEILYADVAFANARRESTSFGVTASDKGEVTVSWYFDPADRNKLSFKLVSPTGADVVTLDEESDLADGYAAISIDNADGSKNGSWQAVTISNAKTTDDVSVSITTESDVHLGVQVSGLDRGLSPMITAMFKGVLPISNAVVRADVFDVKTGERVKSGLPMRDDGQGLDLRANDGLYTLDLKNVLPAGDYEIEVVATTSNASTFESVDLIFAQQECIAAANCDTSLSTATLNTLVGSGLMRTEVTSLYLTANAPGASDRVVVDANPSSPAGPSSSSNANANANANDDDHRGGGCTIGGRDHADFGLLMLLAMALAGLAISRRRRCQDDSGPSTGPSRTADGPDPR